MGCIAITSEAVYVLFVIIVFKSKERQTEGEGVFRRGEIFKKVIVLIEIVVVILHNMCHWKAVSQNHF